MLCMLFFINLILFINSTYSLGYYYFFQWNSLLKDYYYLRQIHETSSVEDAPKGTQSPWSVLNFWGSLLLPRSSLKQFENKDVQNKLLGRICMFCLQCLLKKLVVINLCTPFNLITHIHTKSLSARCHAHIPVWAHGIFPAQEPALPRLPI